MARLSKAVPRYFPHEVNLAATISTFLLAKVYRLRGNEVFFPFLQEIFLDSTVPIDPDPVPFPDPSFLNSFY